MCAWMNIANAYIYIYWLVVSTPLKNMSHQNNFMAMIFPMFIALPYSHSYTYLINIYAYIYTHIYNVHALYFLHIHTHTRT